MLLIAENFERQAVNLMQAAVIAGVHVTNMYKLRNKLGAFKRDGVWYITKDSLRNYIERRAARARAILATAVDADRLKDVHITGESIETLPTRQAERNS